MRREGKEKQRKGRRTRGMTMSPPHILLLVGGAPPSHPGLGMWGDFQIPPSEGKYNRDGKYSLTADGNIFCRNMERE